MTTPAPAVADSNILIRTCRDLDELAACVDLQAQVWGFEDRDVTPRRSFVVARHTGGQVIGAFDISAPGAAPEGDARCLIGFAMAMAGFAQTGPEPVPTIEPYLHSHMLAVHRDYHNRGIGRRLKLFQREEALSRGILRMEWTFDPLEIKNSFLNIVKLGTIVRRYSQNHYGVSSSRLQGTLPTDRLYAEWWLESPRTKCALDGKLSSSPRVEQTIIVPRAIGDWRHTPGERESALRVQRENRRQFEQAFSGGLAVFGFVIDPEGNGIFQLGRWPEPSQQTGAHSTVSTVFRSR